MSFVHVWPDRYVDRWDGNPNPGSLNTFKRVHFLEALKARYHTDAHFCPALLGEYESFPPMKKKGFPATYQALVRYQVLAVDLDAPDRVIDGVKHRHYRTPEWDAAQLECLRGTPWDGAIKYETAGGYRLVWELPEPLNIWDYERTLIQVCDQLVACGLQPDRLFNWERCYRLPFVRRNDEKTGNKPVYQDGKFYESDNPILPVGFLAPIATPTHIDAPTIGAEVASVALPLSLDNHASGRNTFLYRIASSLRNLAWIDEPLMAEMLERVNQRKFPDDPLDFDEIQQLASKVFGQHEPMAGTALDDVVAEPLPTIQIKGGELDIHVREAIQSLSRIDNLYTRGGKLARLTTDTIETLPKPALRTLMCEAAEYIKAKPKKDGGFDMITIDPPLELVDCVFNAGEFTGIRELEQILSFGTLRPDGSFISSSGYDAATMAYLKAGGLQIDVPQTVTRDMAAESLRRLLDIFSDFPFEDETHKAAALAAIITPVLRLAITGPTPLFIFDATTPGSGKSLLADIVSNIAVGEDAARRPQTDDTEMRKEITATLLAGTPVILIDNVNKPLGGPALDAALTSIHWTGRELSRSNMLKLKNVTVWLATGNNIIVKGDLPRRSLRIALNPGMERPEERGGFKIPKLLEYIRKNRASLIRDILILALGRHQDESFVPVGSFGSFESWAYWVRDTVVWAGMDDPLLTQKALREGNQTATWGQVLYNMFECFNPKKSKTTTEEFTAKQLWDLVYDGVGNGPAENKTALSAGWQELTDDNSVRRVGFILKSWNNRVVGGYRLLTNNDKRLTKGATFRVERTDIPNLKSVPNMSVG